MVEHEHDATPGEAEIRRAFEELFGGGAQVKRFRRSRLRYVDLGGDAVLVEQNPEKSSEWAKAAREGKRIAWVLREGEYLARVVEGEVTLFE
jgi:hypothetical protein